MSISDSQPPPPTHTHTRTDLRFKLSQAVKSAKNTLVDSEKISGKWNKDDRSKVNGLCNETNDWLQYNQDALSSAVQQQIADFEAHFEPYLAKLTPPDIIIALKP